MKLFFVAVILPFLIAIGSYAQTAPVTAITGATLVNPNGKPPIADAVVLVQNGRIIRIGTRQNVQIPKDATIIDARGKWIIPGLVDSHVHFFQSGGLYTRPDALDLRKIVSYEKEIESVKNNLNDTFARYLRSGVTSVVDVGGPFWNFEVRAFAEKTEIAPRVVVAGPLVSTYKPPVLSDTQDAPIIKANTPEEARELVRKQAEKKTDLIKIWFVVLPGETPEKHLPVIKAVMDESRRHNLRVAVHATQLETARVAVREGANILVHSVEDKEVDADFIRLLKEKNVLYTPTLTVYSGYSKTFTQQHDFTHTEFQIANPYVMSTLFDLRHIPTENVPKRIKDAIENPRPIQPPAVAMKNLKILQEAGVTVAAGTDAGNIGTLHGASIFRELKTMVDAGLTPAQVLTAATLNGAKLMGREKDLGIIEEGKLADLVILNSDPLANIQNTSDIHLVVKNGKAFQPNEVIKKTPQDIVQQQVNAYNARDLEAFVATYSPNIKLYTHPDTLRGSGHEEMRKQYGDLFKRIPKLHCEIVNRIVMGNFVIDQERVTGFPNNNVINAVAIYEVRDGLIQRVWFVPER
ncbi:MAG: amidohydrolase family protein [Acidobacteriota bacterium]|nr:amidohydrolase family protein [Acidobacteriota bacterium]